MPALVIATLAALTPPAGLRMAASAEVPTNDSLALGRDAAPTYTAWKRLCSDPGDPSPICIVYSEARSPAGQPLGHAAFGVNGDERYLMIETNLLLEEATGLAVAIEGAAPFGVAPTPCRAGAPFCAALLVLDDAMLARLNGGTALRIEAQAARRPLIELRFPLAGFSEASATLP
jgi:invasion protein IalB